MIIKTYKLIEEIENNIPKLEKDLSNMKESVNYCEVPTTRKDGVCMYSFNHRVNGEIASSSQIRSNAASEIKIRRLVLGINKKN